MKCPGQDTIYWKPDYIYEVKCPKCSSLVEFFKDDSFRRCNHCNYRFFNPKKDLGCASYCEHASKCLDGDHFIR